MENILFFLYNLWNFTSNIYSNSPLSQIKNAKWLTSKSQARVDIISPYTHWISIRISVRVRSVKRSGKLFSQYKSRNKRRCRGSETNFPEIFSCELTAAVALSEHCTVAAGTPYTSPPSVHAHYLSASCSFE